MLGVTYNTPPHLPEKAGPPEKVMVKEVWGSNALVEWKPPKDDGNSEVTGYFIQKADKKTMVRDQRGPGWSGLAGRKAGQIVRAGVLFPFPSWGN